MGHALQSPKQDTGPRKIWALASKGSLHFRKQQRIGFGDFRLWGWGVGWRRA